MATTTQSILTGSDTPMGPLQAEGSKGTCKVPFSASSKAGIQYPLQSVSDMMAQYTQAVRTKVTHEATLAYLGAELASLQSKIKDEKIKAKAANQRESKARQVWERAQIVERHTLLESTLESLQDAGVRITKKATRLVTKKLVGRKRARKTYDDETPEQKAKREARNKKQRAYRAKKKGTLTVHPKPSATRGQAVPSKPIAVEEAGGQAAPLNPLAVEESKESTSVTSAASDASAAASEASVSEASEASEPSEASNVQTRGDRQGSLTPTPEQVRRLAGTARMLSRQEAKFGTIDTKLCINAAVARQRFSDAYIAMPYPELSSDALVREALGWVREQGTL